MLIVGMKPCRKPSYMPTANVGMAPNVTDSLKVPRSPHAGRVNAGNQ
jgi:hypothetical protein